MAGARRVRGWGLSAAVAVALAGWLLAPLGVDLAARPAALPGRLSDGEFWRLVEEFSEPNGQFQSDNLVSNERPFQHVVPVLKQLKRGGVYLGVAPDQNFTYIVALEPRLAFIVDIRRGNLLQHLMYKAVIELSEDRGDFVAKLFSRKRPANLDFESTPEEIFDEFVAVPSDPALYAANLRAIELHLTRTHGFPLTPDDVQGLAYVYGMFYQFGPALTYSSSAGRGGRNMPSYADLQQATDLEGQNRAYLSSEESFKTLKAIQEKNLIVPLVGDFAGPKALRAVGRYLVEHNATVTAYYTSNVEQYLFQNGVWEAFYANVAQLPTDEGSTFIRSARGASLLDPIRLLLKDVSDGKIRTYADVTIRGGIR